MRRVLAAAAITSVVAVLVVGAVATAGDVSYRPRRGDGCGPPDPYAVKDWGHFVVGPDRICGSYPWSPQRVMAGSTVGFMNRARGSRHLVSWRNSRSRRWSLDTWIGPDGYAQKGLRRRGRYLFRDPAHSRLVRYTRRNGTRDVKCRGACGYIKAEW
ncbi:MAG: hypothetical protein ACRDJ5_08940 [Actinomycetota bacterium]